MLTVTLVATFAATALWQQWRAVEVESAERTRVQAAWVLIGALDWSRLILREDGRAGGADHLGEPWALPLQEARLSSFLAADRSGTVTTSAADSADLAAGAQDAFLSGQIVDLQSRINVLNLADNGKVSEPAFRAFEKLFNLLGLPPQELQGLALNIVSAQDGADASAPLMPQRFEQLSWLGLSPASIAALAPHATLLPARTTVNLNTASAETLFASAPAIDLATAQRLVDARANTPLRSVDEAARLIGDTSGTFNKDSLQGVSSRYFEVRGRLRLGDVAVEERSLVQRDGIDVRTLWRERGALGLDAQAAPTAR